MPCTDAQVEHYKTRGYVAGLRVLSDEQIDQLKERIEDILQGRVPFPRYLMGKTVERSRAKGQPPSVKVVNILRREPLFRPSSTMRPSASWRTSSCPARCPCGRTRWFTSSLRRGDGPGLAPTTPPGTTWAS